MRPKAVSGTRADLARKLLGLVLFASTIAFALANRPAGDFESLAPLIVIPLVIAPAIVLFNATEYRIMARLADQDVYFRQAAKVSVLASLANFLPLPGAALVRLGALKSLGSSSGAALRATALVTMSWLTTALCVAALSLGLHQGGTLAPILFAAAVLPALVALLASSFQKERKRALVNVLTLLCLNFLTILLRTASYLLILDSLGTRASFRGSLALTLAPLMAQAVGFLPAGLGLQEALAGLIGATIGIPASSAILASAADRTLTLLALGLLQAGILARTRRSKISESPQPNGNVPALPDRDRVSSRPELLVLASTFPIRRGDGTPEFVLSLASALQTDFGITVLVPRRKGAPNRERIESLDVNRFRYFPLRWETLTQGAILRNLAVQPWRWVQVPFFMASFFLHAFGLCLRKKPDAVHAHWIIPAGLIALTLKLLLGIPYVLTAHGTDVYGLRRFPFSAWKRLIVRHAHIAAPGSREMGRLIGLDEAELDQLVVPMGVDVAQISAQVGSRTPEPGRFLYIGRLVQSKGVDVLLRAVSHVSNIRVVIAGDGKDRDALEELADGLSIQNRVEFLGQTGKARIYEELRLATAVVVPTSGTEGTAQVMSEAMAAGVPVIASDVGGLRERIRSGENGILVEPGSVHSLAGALRTAFSHPESMERMARRAKDEIAGSPLDLESTARKYRGFFDAAALPQARVSTLRER